jgi:LPS sulfotransferase NodH
MRPDILDLIGSEYDQAPGLKAGEKTLIICAAPRTGSYELCRWLWAAGIGAPHEYFNPTHAEQIGSRLDFRGDPLTVDRIGPYINLLRERRSANNVFAVKVQYWQFERFLRNSHGSALFGDANVVHLFRPDAATQFTSWRAARLTGRWDFSARHSTQGVQSPPEDQKIAQTLADIDRLVGEDSGFRRLFILLGIRPQFFTLNEIVKSPEAVVDQIASALHIPVNRERLAAMISQSAPYNHDFDAWESVSSDLTDAVRERLFSG